MRGHCKGRSGRLGIIARARGAQEPAAGGRFLRAAPAGARRRKPSPAALPAAAQRADYLWDWEKQWQGDFYTMASDESGWPPGAEFNGDGLRDRSHAVEQPEGVARVAFLGDSVTFGHGLEPGEAYPQVLQALLEEEGRPVEVLSAALWGWSTRQERIAYERLVRRYRPERVVVAVCLNDIPR
jgi:hypothetical protein